MTLHLSPINTGEIKSLEINFIKIRKEIRFPLSVVINKGTVHDIKFIDTHLKDFSNTNIPTILLADKGYVSNNLRITLLSKNILIMTPRKSNQKKCENFDKNLYKKRIRIENTFQKLKIYRRINMRYDHYLKTFNSFVMLSLSFILFKHMTHIL